MSKKHKKISRLEFDWDSYQDREENLPDPPEEDDTDDWNFDRSDINLDATVTEDGDDEIIRSVRTLTLQALMGQESNDFDDTEDSRSLDMEDMWDNLALSLHTDKDSDDEVDEEGSFIFQSKRPLTLNDIFLDEDNDAFNHSSESIVAPPS